MEATPTRGSKKTISLAKKHNKPCLHLHPSVVGATAKFRASVFQENTVRRLNIAGSREPKELYHFVQRVLTEAMGHDAV